MRKIAITLGDPAGIGPEIIRAALADKAVARLAEFECLGSTDGVIPGHPTEQSARAAASALEEAVSRAVAGEFAAVVTGPIAKHAMHAIGFPFPGQTEFFAERTATRNHAMCLTGGKLTVALVTAHVPLAEVAARLQSDEIVRVGSLLSDFCRKRGESRPSIAVAGLNPHAGENGDLGGEEQSIITPAVARLNRNEAHRSSQNESHATFVGPISPDTVFLRAASGEFDAVLCMYHDQGLIPLKLHAFDQGVNVTLGLPFPRTSPDHGTAFEIAGRGIARPDSMIAAIRLAVELAT